MRKSTSANFDNTIFLWDILFTVIIFCISFWIRTLVPPYTDRVYFSSHVFVLPLLLVFISSSMSYFRGYQDPGLKNLIGYTWSIFRAVTLSVSALLVLLFFLQIEYVSRFVIILFAGLEVLTLILIRIAAIAYYKKQVKSGKRSLRVLIVGSKSRARDLYMALQEQTVWGLTVVGFVDPDPALTGSELLGIPIIGSVENIHEYLKNNVIDEVIIAISRSLLKDAEPIAIACEEEGIRLRFMADIFNVQVAGVSLSTIGDIPVLNMEPVVQDPQQLLAKRLFDVACTVLALPLLLPVCLLIALAIKLDSPGPVFFIQQRVGMRKHIFPMYKFRSMQVDAEAQLKDIEHLNEAQGPIFKIKNDPRVTRVGSFIRKTSLDELPQLINVLRGEMSLVGPRPMSIRDVDRFDRGIQRKRFSVKPGLTCIWQISGRSNLPFEKWLKLDLEYIEGWNFWLDIKILFKTIPAVLRTRGAL